MTRLALPNRRPSELISFEHEGISYEGSVSFDLRTGAPAEIFLDGGTVGSAVQSVARDSAVAASLALQHGASLALLRGALTRQDDGSPAGPLGRLLDLIGAGGWGSGF